LHHCAVIADRLAHYQRDVPFKLCPGVFTAVDFTDALIPATVGEDHQVPDKVGCMGPRKCHKHAVIALSLIHISEPTRH
jgi:hypothetical protein